MAKSKGSKVSKKAQYSAYNMQDRRQKNREARLARHAKKHPNDKQAASAAPTKTFRTRSKTKGNFPDAKIRLRHPITGQPIPNVSYDGWEGKDYDPIPPKGRRNAKAA